MTATRNHQTRTNITMPDLTINTALVEVDETTENVRSALGDLIQFGEDVDNGEIVYEASDSKFWLADCTDAVKSQVAGVAIIGGAADGWGHIARGPDVDIIIGATLAVPELYVLSSNPGKIMTLSDLTTTGWYLVKLGFGKTTTILNFDKEQTGIQVP